LLAASLELCLVLGLLCGEALFFSRRMEFCSAGGSGGVFDRIHREDEQWRLDGI
jgi:hypothetical protein